MPPARGGLCTSPFLASTEPALGLVEIARFRSLDDFDRGLHKTRGQAAEVEDCGDSGPWTTTLACPWQRTQQGEQENPSLDGMMPAYFSMDAKCVGTTDQRGSAGWGPCSGVVETTGHTLVPLRSSLRYRVFGTFWAPWSEQNRTTSWGGWDLGAAPCGC